MDLHNTILHQRTNPAVLIFDREDRLLYFNQEAEPFLQGTGQAPRQAGDPRPAVPGEITGLCARLKGSPSSETKNFALIHKDPGRLYAAMAHFIRPAGNQKHPDHIIVIIQPVVDSHIDLKKIKDQYGLSRREEEVIKLICRGYSNREISEQLYISEFTTRDHLKNIMRKTGVSSRSKIVALLI